jgi:transcription elongation GreA/GreB family factor
MYYFLKEDFLALSAEIEKIADRIKGFGREVGLSCKEGAETFHDNFALEDSHRQQFMWSTRLRDLIRIRNESRVFSPQQEGRVSLEKVSLGLKVTVEDENTGEMRVIKIGSYMIFDDQEGLAVSYEAPLARMLLGAKVGDIRESTIAGKKKVLQIIKIE